MHPPLAAVLAILPGSAGAEPPAGYRLVWADEFERPGLPDPCP